MEQYMPIVWIGFAIFMLLCEGFTTQLVSIWFVLGSVCAAVTTIFTSNITIQSAVFLVVSLVSLIVTRPLVKRFKKRNKTTGTNADRHIGQVGFMLTDSLENWNNHLFNILTSEPLGSYFFLKLGGIGVGTGNIYKYKHFLLSEFTKIK